MCNAAWTWHLVGSGGFIALWDIVFRHRLTIVEIASLGSIKTRISEARVRSTKTKDIAQY